MTSNQTLAIPPCEAGEDTVPIGPRCEYTALTRYGTEQCDEQVADAASVDQNEREFCSAHSQQVREMELADYGQDDDYGVSFS